VLVPGQLVPLSIEKPAAGGPMIARVDGQIVLVAGAIPGERVTARIDRIGKGVAYAQTMTVDEPSPDRRTPFTDPLCGGCAYAHVAYARQLEIKAQVVADAFARIGRIELPSAVRVAPSPDEGYRMRARLHLRDGHIGFFREGTHEICDARATRQLLPATSDVLDRLAGGLRSTDIDAVRELEVSENVDASDRVIHLTTTAPVEPASLTSLARVDGLTGLSISHQSPVSGRQTAGRIGQPPVEQDFSPARSAAPAFSRPSRIAQDFGRPAPVVQDFSPARSDVIAGSPYVTDVLSINGHAVTLRRHVLAFFQANRFLLHDLVAHVSERIEQGSSVVDLYAGVGVFAVTAAMVRGARVIAVEGDRVAARDLDANAAAAEGAVETVHQAVEAFTVGARPRPDTLIVDPPRTGMSKEALEGAIRLGATQVLYVSCDVATLARDSRRLVDAGYRLTRIHAFDLFPNTPHVETVVEFENLRI